MENAIQRQDRLIATLLQQQRFPHDCADLRSIETHISWILLAGPYAYKIKRPVDFGFLDYSDPQMRHHYCLEELRLNRRTAPELYLGVVPITGSPEMPVIDGEGPVLEYAVKMVRFAEEELFSRRADDDRLPTRLLDQLARRIAGFHAGLPGTRAFGHPRQVYAPMEENFRQLRELGRDSPQLAQLEDWTARTYRTLEECLTARHEGGHIRECHGDLHLGNIVLHGGHPLPFDGIEFNDNLRFIDTASEIAFLAMDLDDHRRHDLAARFLNRYLEWSGDYGALPLLRFYQVYRAMVRAKVAAIRLAQVPEDDAVRRSLDSYLALAERYTKPARPFLAITCGVSGSGKSTAAALLVEGFGAIRLRSDVERKRLFGLAPDADSGSVPGGGIYTPEATRRTYDRLLTLSGDALAAGFSTVTDATFLKRNERDRFAALAAQRGIPFIVVEVDTAEAELRQRVSRRRAHGHDPSEADAAVLEHQLRHRERPGDDEPVCRLDSSGRISRPAVIDAVKAQLARQGYPLEYPPK